MHKNNIFGKNSQSDAKKIMRKQLFPEKSSGKNSIRGTLL